MGPNWIFLRRAWQKGGGADTSFISFCLNYFRHQYSTPKVNSTYAPLDTWTGKLSAQSPVITCSKHRINIITCLYLTYFWWIYSPRPPPPNRWNNKANFLLNICAISGLFMTWILASLGNGREGFGGVKALRPDAFLRVVQMADAHCKSLRVGAAHVDGTKQKCARFAVWQ
jgi:hypothetical protein